MFVENENIPLVTHQDEDCEAHHDDEYDDNSKPNATVEEIRFTTQSASKLLLRLKVKQNKVASLNRHLNVTGDVDLINLDGVTYTKNLKKKYYNIIFLKWW